MSKAKMRYILSIFLFFSIVVTPALGQAPQKMEGLWRPIDSTEVSPIYVGDEHYVYTVEMDDGLCVLSPIRDSTQSRIKPPYRFKEISRDTIYFRKRVYYRTGNPRRNRIIDNCMIDE